MVRDFRQQLPGDHHHPRNGLGDARKLPKKGGGGQHNWGTLQDQVKAVTDDMPEKDIIPQDSTITPKLNVLDQESFDKLRKAASEGSPSPP
jgi:hypothetical protein